MSYQIEQNVYTGDGTASPFWVKLDNWLLRSAAMGGAGWTIHDDLSTVTNTAISAIDTGTDIMTAAGHNLHTGQEVYLATTGVIPTGLTAGATYFAIVVDSANFKVATTLANSITGTQIDITAAGSANTVHNRPIKVYRNQSETPAPNDVVRYLKIWHEGSVSKALYIQEVLYWNPTTHIGYGYWSGRKASPGTSGSITYDLRGNTTFLAITANLAGVNQQIIFDTFTAPTSLIEATSKTGALTSGVTAGSSVVLPLNAGQYQNFTVGNYYYIYDMVSHTWVDYIKVTGIDTVGNTITADLIRYNYPAGAVIGAYPHRFCSFGYNDNSSGNQDNIITTNGGTNASIPYMSRSQYCVHNQTGTINISAKMEVRSILNSQSLSQPDDQSNYYALRPVISELSDNTSTALSTSANRILGTADNLYLSSTANNTANVTQRLIGGYYYKTFMQAYYCTISTSSDQYVAVEVQDTAVT